MIINGKTKIIYITVTFFSFALIIAQTIKVNTSKLIIDSVTTGKWDSIKTQFLLLALSIMSCIGAELFRQILFSVLEKNINISLKNYAINGVMNRSNKACSDCNTQEEVSTFNNDIMQIAEDYYLNISEIIFQISSLVIYSLFLFSISPIIAIIILLGNVLVLCTPTLFSNRLQARKESYLRSLKDFNIILADFIKGQILLRVSLVLNKMGKITKDQAEYASETKYEYSLLSSKSNICTGFMSYLSEFVMYIVGAVLILKGRLTIGGLMASIQVSEMLVHPTVSIANSINALNSIKGIRKSFLQKYGEGKKETKIDQGDNIEEILEIEFRNINIKRKNGFEMKNFNFTFYNTKKYILYGENGSGKSTILKLLTKEIVPDSGNIYINGIDINNINININSLYTQIGFVFQNSFLMTDSIYNNITLYRNYKENEIESLFNLMHFSNITFQDIKKRVYQENSSNISGGEKQKICLLRVLLEQKKILFLDEIFAFMDKESRIIIEKELLDNSFGIIHIEHEIIPELICKYDEIILLESGNIAKVIVASEDKEEFIYTYL